MSMPKNRSRRVLLYSTRLSRWATTRPGSMGTVPFEVSTGISAPPVAGARMGGGRLAEGGKPEPGAGPTVGSSRPGAPISPQPRQPATTVAASRAVVARLAPRYGMRCDFTGNTGGLERYTRQTSNVPCPDEEPGSQDSDESVVQGSSP